MSILTDKQISRLCMPPTAFGIDARIYKSRDDEVEEPLWMVQDEADFAISIRTVDSMQGVLYKAVRKPTEAEIAQYGMITPFVPYQVRTRSAPPRPGSAIPVDNEKILSYGLSSMGYDVRLADEFKIFSNVNAHLIDPLDFDHNCCVDHKGPYCIIPPNSYILGCTVEHFKIPRDVMVVCVGKSTYARLGAIVNVTPIEPGFEGKVVIEISNATPLPLKVYADMGIAQFMFFKSSEPCEVSYAEGNRKYQGQTGLTIARL